MGRPKGSTNRKKVVSKVEATPKAVDVPDEVREPVAPMPTKPQGHSVTVKEEFNPKPDMGKIKPPADDKKLCQCLHTKAVHYGPSTDWCNTGGCQCQAFNEK